MRRKPTVLVNRSLDGERLLLDWVGGRYELHSGDELLAYGLSPYRLSEYALGLGAAEVRWTGRATLEDG